ncbi:cytochrome ubiquinol oxidase subunit I [Silvimonas sp. JCM 19000]
MTALSALDLARIQFAFTVSFHIIFPGLSIGLASYLAVLEGLWLKTQNPLYRNLYLFWSKVFAVGFAMGVVSGVVMSYEFGTNWSRFSTFAGAITGPLLAYEVMTAFFLEAGFLGIMLFGWTRVGPKAHFGATLAVAVGTLISTFWILASNSWMHTPAGYAIEAGRVVPRDWLEIIFNPSFPYRLVHMTLAAFIETACIVAASGAWHLLRGRDDAAIRKMFGMALGMLLVTTPIQALVGDAHGINTREHQPAKIAAIEGLWETETGGTALNLIGFPDMATETTHYALQIPHLGSLILTHSWDGEIKGLKEFAPQDRPNSLIVFWSFRIMVGLSVLTILAAAVGLLLRRMGKLHQSRWYLRWMVLMGPAGMIALLMGWITTEAGRQPWVVYGLLRTRDAVSPVSAQQVGVSLLIFVVAYTLVFGTGIYYLLKLLRTGPQLEDTHKEAQQTNRSVASQGRNPIAAVDQDIEE